jgi:hypothetical protein
LCETSGSRQQGGEDKRELAHEYDLSNRSHDRSRKGRSARRVQTLRAPLRIIDGTIDPDLGAAEAEMNFSIWYKFLKI